MSRRSQRTNSFPDKKRAKMPPVKETIVADEPSRGIFGFFRDFGVRETIESIVIAIVLALMFRAYEAEAFIIPTGSMAPSLQGQHMDLECQNCQLRYRSGASKENSETNPKQFVDSTYCPICQYKTKVYNTKEPDHKSNNGDRILVNKFVYDFSEPERYDVIVFKNPNDGKQNYIKRLIGLPGDNLLIENGDIYVMNETEGEYEKTITRKPPEKLRNVLQPVDDTNHIGKFLSDVKWPSRWQPFDGSNQWSIDNTGEHPVFRSSAQPEAHWLRYRHYQPLKNEWGTISSGLLPPRFRNNNLPLGRLIGDQYGYNDGVYQNNEALVSTQNLGLHWVGDLGLEFWADIKSSQGTLMFDVVEGGVHFVCKIDIETGKATLAAEDESSEAKVTFQDANGKAVETPTGGTKIQGSGAYHIMFVNADDRLNLWIDNQYIEFDAASFSRNGIPVPTYSPDDSGDAEPVGIATENAEVEITRIKVLRDLYYTSVKGQSPFGSQVSTENETGESISIIEAYHRDPASWGTDGAREFFTTKKGQTEPMFRLEKGATPDKDQFLPMGDNSPRSLDGRVWDGEKFVERDMLIGRAMLIYWPHTLNKPIKYFPNFQRMGFIK